MKPKSKNPNLAVVFFKLFAQGVTALVFMIIIAIFMVASDMAEHPELSGYEPGTNTIEIVTDIIKTIV